MWLLIALAALLSVHGAAAPCDILAAAGNPCVAAHSTTRALYAAYSGALYNITRASDGAVFSVPLLAPGGFADKAAHDSFCPAQDCVISHVLDQSPLGNHLGQRHKLVNASQHPIGMQPSPHNPPIEAYGMYFDPGFGYHVNYTTGMATGNEPETLFAVMSGTHYNNKCCFE